LITRFKARRLQRAKILIQPLAVFGWLIEHNTQKEAGDYAERNRLPLFFVNRF
jgi:hypothetical protein